MRENQPPNRCVLRLGHTLCLLVLEKIQSVLWFNETYHIGESRVLEEQIVNLISLGTVLKNPVAQEQRPDLCRDLPESQDSA